MKTVVISGYYGYDNTGDEALLASITASLKAMVPSLRIIVLSAKPEKTAQVYGVEAVNRLNLLEVIGALRKADLLISGGGSLLQDVTGMLTIPYYLGIVLLSKILGKRVMFYAQGIGPVKGILGKMLIRLIGNKVDFITLRDSESADLLKRLGVKRPPVEVTADPVFSTEITVKKLKENIPGYETIFNGEPVVGIFIREWQGIQAYKKAVAGLADFLIEEGKRVVFIPMQYPSDIGPAIEIKTLMKNEPLIIKQGYAFEQLIGLVQPMELVVGMRLHALIIAAVCGVPMVGLGYDPKVSDFLNEIRQPVLNNLYSLEAAQLIEITGKALEQIETKKVDLNKARLELKQKAQRNAEIAVALLNQNLPS